MNGYDPGANEWPTILIFIHSVGSISSFMASSYLLFFIEPKRVFVFVIV